MPKTRPGKQLKTVNPDLPLDVLLIILNFVIDQLGLYKAIGFSSVSKSFDSFFKARKQGHFFSLQSNFLEYMQNNKINLNFLEYMKNNRINHIVITDPYEDSNVTEVLPSKVLTLTFNITIGIKKARNHTKQFAIQLSQQFKRNNYLSDVPIQSDIVPSVHRPAMDDPSLYICYIDEATFVCQFRIKQENLYEAIDFIKTIGVVADDCEFKDLTKNEDKKSKCSIS